MAGKSCSRRGGASTKSACSRPASAQGSKACPDSYVIDVPLNQALFGFGDAVCVPAVEWIVQHYLTPMAFELHAKAAIHGGKK